MNHSNIRVAIKMLEKQKSIELDIAHENLKANLTKLTREEMNENLDKLVSAVVVIEYLNKKLKEG
jgi:hypothetical protein